MDTPALAPSASAQLSRALGYPYPAPDHSYRFVDGAVEPLVPGPDDLMQWRSDGRVPVLAIGSNRAPSQLARKFGDFPPGCRIPVTAVDLVDWEVVYGPHLTGYGSVPAVLYPAPGVVAHVHVTWLDAAQLERMHSTEGVGTYVFDTMPGRGIVIPGAGRVGTVWAYRGRLGALVAAPEVGRCARLSNSADALLSGRCPIGHPIPVAAVAATGRLWPALDQRAVQALVRDRLAPDADLDDFVLETVRDRDVRRARSRLLMDWALPQP